MKQAPNPPLSQGEKDDSLCEVPPYIVVDKIRHDDILTLRHNHTIDGIGIDLERAKNVLEYIERI